MASHSMKVVRVLTSVLALTVILTDNTDRNLGGMNNERFLQEKQEFKLDNSMKEFIDKNKYFCINGKDPQTMNALQQLEEFKKGPCAPLAVMPGVLGTSLQVKIDCEVLQKENPQIFSNCGWTTCSRFNILGSRPAPEYKLWVGSILSKTNLLQTKNSKCFGDLISLQYDKKINKMVANKGINVTWYGNTPESKSDSDCGANAIKDFTDDFVMKLTTPALNGFHNLIEVLKNLGYQSGLTFQALPYDFRQSIAENETKDLIKNAIDQLYSLTGKKTVLYAHSLGSLHILDYLSTMDIKYKDEKIKQFIAIGPPFIGAPKSFINMIGGDPQYIQSILGFQIGINYHSQTKFTYSSSSTYDLLPKNTFDIFKGQPWLNELISRINYEKNPQDSSKIPFKNLFPGANSYCVNKDIFKFRKNSQCKSGLMNLFEESLLSIQENNFKAKEEDLLAILKQYALDDAETVTNLYKKAQQAEGLRKLKNPEVPTAIIFGGMLETTKSLKYKQNPKEVSIKNQNFYFPESQESTIGDGTVPTYSAITPAFKWAYEFENGHPNSKPVKLIEYCSSYSSNSTFYEGQSKSGENIQTKNSYFGIPCECENSSSFDKCNHPSFINDKHVIGTVFQALQTNEKPIKTKTYTLNEIQDIIYKCPVLYK